MYILSICPNSASCERGFSTLGWLTGKRRLRLSVEQLESMTKLIIYYRLNASRELVFYGEKMQESQIMKKVQLALAKPIEDNYDDFDEFEEQKTISGEIIPKDNVRVVIEPLWLDNLLNLNHENIITSLGEIPIDDDFDLIDENNNENDNKEKNIRCNILNYTANDLIAEFSKFSKTI